MNQMSATPTQNNLLSISTATDALENQQTTLCSMLDALELALYGSGGGAKQNETEAVKRGGIESRLSNVVNTNERLLGNFDRILSKI